MHALVELVRIYECLCDRTRLRIVNLLLEGPLCVCHFQRILREPQVKISKHLAYLRSHRLVEVEQEANWRIYRLPAKPTRALQANLDCLRDCATDDSIFARDLARRKTLLADLGDDAPTCCAQPAMLSRL